MEAVPEWRDHPTQLALCAIDPRASSARLDPSRGG
jgi:hypothetical protein